MSSTDQDDKNTDLSTHDIVQLYQARSKIKHNHQASTKRSLSRHGPLINDLKLKKKNSSAESDSYKDKGEVLLAQLEAVQKLPRNSNYARHRKACLEKAITLLELDRYLPFS